MALNYCEVCGVLIKGEGGQQLPEGVICEDCFDSRRVMVPEESDVTEVREKVQFECVYCRSVLRIEVLQGRRTRIRCPKCSEIFFMREDGTVEARLEGNTTAVLMGEDFEPRSLTPSGTRGHDRTQPLGSKTQPVVPSKMFEDLPFLPERPIEITPRADPVPTPQLPRPKPEPEPALDLAPEPELDLMPEVGASPALERRKQELRASDEGQIDLGVGELKGKTTRLKKGGGRATKRRKKKRKSSDDGEDEPARKSSDDGDDEPAPKKKARSNLGEKRTERRDKQRRATQAYEKAEKLESEKARRTLGAAAIWALFIIPLALSLTLADMARRGASLTDPRKNAFGKNLESLGTSVDGGVRSLNELLPPQARHPDIDAERESEDG